MSDEDIDLPPDAPLATRVLRAALGRFATGVTVVSCLDAAGQPVGLTVNSFSALSLEPPLVLWALRLASPSVEAFTAARYFAVNVLAENQVGLSRRFAAAVPHKFDAGSWRPGQGGAPVLAGCAAHFECEQVSHQPAGDHRLFIGRVLRLDDAPLAPLLFHAGHYHTLGSPL
jgi:3-hydroxy-9,10-secoandrosta-1,3,5(10)-triene-9,17-dione monooxygenase reductase component